MDDTYKGWSFVGRTENSYQRRRDENNFFKKGNAKHKKKWMMEFAKWTKKIIREGKMMEIMIC